MQKNTMSKTKDLKKDSVSIRFDVHISDMQRQLRSIAIIPTLLLNSFLPIKNTSIKDPVCRIA
jgi:hypothetical protein